MPRTPGLIPITALFLVIMLALSGGVAAPAVSKTNAASADVSQEAARSASEKFDRIGEAHDSGQSFGTIQLTEMEANSYLAYELTEDIPAGISDVLLRFLPSRIGGSAVVDFDKLKEGMRTQPNPFVDFLLRGEHMLEVEGSASGVNGVGEFRLERVLIDGVEVPRMVVDYMIEQFLLPRYPSAAINRPFELPSSIDTFQAQTGSVTMTGKQAR
jgi:hypothetical protein